jgi:hypothetical protein
MEEREMFGGSFGGGSFGGACFGGEARPSAIKTRRSVGARPADEEADAIPSTDKPAPPPEKGDDDQATLKIGRPAS